MQKDRLAAFMDAILAIIMTILVLELEQPASLTWAGIFELWPSYLAYALSFFWIGTMWANLHALWHLAERVSQKTVWWSMVLLFASSFFSYVTKMVAANFEATLAHLVYALVVFGVTLTFIPLTHVLAQDNPEVEGLEPSKSWYIKDMGLKVVGLILTLIGFTPAFMVTMLVAMLISIHASLNH